MKIDPAIYEFLATGAEALRILTGGLVLIGPYRFRSLTLKGIERRLDGVYEPDGHAGPVYVIEYQAQPVPGAWYNLLAKIGLYGEEHPRRDVRGILIFTRIRDDPRLPRLIGGVDSVARGLPGAVSARLAGAGTEQSLSRRLRTAGSGRGR
ncbi:DUF2887 domain-containing protein [Thiocystis violascens]|uniref:Uncharacterized protein n=1 Tax=Thiocystis violascens (strain ATCC 17096 / DSM 198 / 6111) TaxID=765911 RepID=I3Y5K8_THIV6|nr:DUF2887 domain-containing protein [Thiocystis violascens]AFL72276.1 Protein of unknown function (DUF2887) [Thiocystis violascens DSM 198]